MTAAAYQIVRINRLAVLPIRPGERVDWAVLYKAPADLTPHFVIVVGLHPSDEEFAQAIEADLVRRAQEGLL